MWWTRVKDGLFILSVIVVGACGYYTYQSHTKFETFETKYEERVTKLDKRIAILDNVLYILVMQEAERQRREKKVSY